MALPLKGIRILELDQDIVGCYGTLPVTALGAEVITIQPHKGDTGQGQTVDWP